MSKPRAFTLYPEAIRKSTMLRLIEEGGKPGWDRAVAEVEAVHAQFPACPEHGKLDDPAIVLVGPTGTEKIGIVCPWCSGGEMLSLWEKEANPS